MRRIIICLLAMGISVSLSAQIIKKKKKTPVPAAQTDSSAIKKDSSTVKKDSTADKQNSDDAKFDYKSANKKAVEQEEESPSDNKTQPDSAGASNSATKSGTTTKSGSGSGTSGTKATSRTSAAKAKPAPKPKPMTAKEKKQADEDAAALEASTPKGVEALYYKFPIEYLPVVKEFMDYKQSESPTDELHRVRIKDDNTMRKQIIRFKDLDRGYMMLQKPGDSKYTKLQVYKMNNGNLIMAVEQSDCPSGICHGTLQFYSKTAGGWKESTEEYFPQIDTKFVIDRLRSAYKKEYKDLELYDAQNYEESDDKLKKAITYQISPDDGSIIIQEENLPCKLYSMTWDIKKEKFVLKKIEK